MYSFIIIGCERDLALLELQAQSMSTYLTPGEEIILIINEDRPRKFLQGFFKFKHYYDNFNLKIVNKNDFSFPGGQPYVDQQILKMAAATLTDNHLIVLDCQNFLCKPYVELPVFDDKIPYRHGPYSMEEEIWSQYCERLNHSLPLNIHNMCLSTPIYLHNKVIRNMIDHLGRMYNKNNSNGTIAGFAKWFYSATRSKSEFALYLQWCEKNHGLHHYHYFESDFFDWAGPYLRDHHKEGDNDNIKFQESFEAFYQELVRNIKYDGIKSSDSVIRNYKRKWAWSSINHRAWGSMSTDQFNRLTKVLNDVKLNTDCLKSYRENYVHIPI